jgi:hypothetical protein
MERKLWVSPQLVVHGSVEQITQQPKIKVTGGGDDVILNNQQLQASNVP